jgi:hypothetical protein
MLQNNSTLLTRYLITSIFYILNAFSFFLAQVSVFLFYFYNDLQWILIIKITWKKVR